MKGMSTPALLVLFCVLFFSTCYATVQDFCVADTKGPQGPSGYNCKDPNTVTVDDFSTSGLNIVSNTSNFVKAGVRPALLGQVPGLNGLGIAMARFDIGVGGVFPVHTHPHGTEFVVLLEGSVIAGFVSSTANKVYTKTLNGGDAFVVPKGLLHFVVNNGTTPASGIVSWSSESPGFQILPTNLFGNDLPSQLVAQTTFLDITQVQKLKQLIGGTN